VYDPLGHAPVCVHAPMWKSLDFNIR